MGFFCHQNLKKRICDKLYEKASPTVGKSSNKSGELQMFHKIIETLERIESKVDGKDKWLGTKQACDYCNLSEKTLRRSVLAGTLKCSNRVGRNLYLKSDLDKWLSAR